MPMFSPDCELGHMVNHMKRNISRTNELQVFTDLNNLHFVSDFQNFDDHLIVCVKSEGLNV